MSIEEDWANKRESENERGELEINSEKRSKVDEICMERRCIRKSHTTYDVIQSGFPFSHMEISLCDLHGGQEAAFKLYRYYHDGF